MLEKHPPKNKQLAELIIPVNAAGPGFFRLHPQEGHTICIFYNLPGQKAKKKLLGTNLAERFKIGCF